MIDIIGNRHRFLVFTGIVMLVCVIFLAVFGLKSGIEFSSGSVMTIDFDNAVEQEELAAELAGIGYDDAIIQQLGDEGYLIRFHRPNLDEKIALNEGLTAALGGLTVTNSDDVAPIIATETTRDAAIAVAIAAVGILLYVAWAFRRMPHPFRYGTCAIIALVHDTLVALGVFAILGGIMGWEINLMFVTGILAVIGYSVNDTVVAFDRIRENQLRNERYSFSTVVNNSLVETISRSLNTSLTTVVVILALMLFVGTAIQNFAVVLLVGVLAGTYSSIFLAPALLVVWQTGKWRGVKSAASQTGEA